jgi:hypothetical protein
MKKIWISLITLIMTITIFCPMLASAAVLNGWKDYGYDVFDKQFSRTTMVANADGSITLDTESKKGGFCVANETNTYNLHDFSMEFRVYASPVVGADWYGFALSSNKSWYSDNFGILVLAKNDTTKTAKMSPTPLLGGTLQEVRINKSLPFFVDGTKNTFSLKKVGTKFVATINGTEMLYNDPDTDWDGTFQNKMSMVDQNTPGGNVYLQFAESCTDSQGEVKFIIDKINDKSPITVAASSIASSTTVSSSKVSSSTTTTSKVSSNTSSGGNSSNSSSTLSSSTSSIASTIDSAISSTTVSPVQTATTSSQSKKGSDSFPFIPVLIVIVVLIAGGGILYYFLIFRKKA